MKRNARSHGRESLPLVDPLFAEALSPRTNRNSVRHNKSDRKTQQLCRQVQRALSLALAGECYDDVLRELYVEAVLPAPDASRLLVRVVIPAHVEVALADVLERLDRARGRLRQLVAEAITRKRAPELDFIPASPGEAIP